MAKTLCISLAKRNEEIPELLDAVSNNLKLSKADTFSYILRRFQIDYIQEALEDV
jgi:hypothetical protein